jgi:acetylglutamate kinase
MSHKLKKPVERAQVLAEALPYIQQFNGKTIVVKYGGNAMISDALRNAVMSDIILLHLVGIHVVLVHGGGPDINDMLKKIGKESKFVDGLRYTDQETIDVVQEVLCGKVNKNLVAALNRHGGKALGLSGLDASLFEAKVKNPKYGLVGEITKVNPDIVLDSIAKGYIPVVSTVAQGWDAQCSYNINADTAASKLAIALGAEKLILLTDIAGLMMDPKDEDTLMPIVHKEDVPRLREKGIISGGMIPKIECCVDALDAGVSRAHILDGRVPHCILIELLSDQGVGTMML